MSTYITNEELRAAKCEIKTLIRSTKDLLEEVANDAKLYRELFDAQYYDDYVAAWKDFSGGAYFEELAVKLDRATSSMLYFSGLFGSQLKLKLRIVGDRLKQWQHGPKTKKVIKRVLEAIDVVLDSILDALGMKTGLKELKDMLLAQI